MRASLQLLVLLLVLAASMAVSHGQEYYTVKLSGDPSDCIQSLTGAGRYPAGAQVTVSAKPTTNCRFLGWEIVKGARFNYTSANPFFFYIDSDFEAKAVFERLYTGPGGEVIQRTSITPVLNVSLPRELAPQPIIARVGEPVRYVFQPEITMAEKKYVFLYAEALGKIFDTNDVAFTAPLEAVEIKAYYYTFVRFLNEYYPLDQFTTIDAKPVQVSETERRMPAFYKVAGERFPIDRPLPKQLIHLAEVEYVVQYRVTVVAEGAEAPLTVNGQAVTVNGVYRLWADSGTTLTVTCSKRLERHYLEKVDTYNIQPSGECLIAGPVNGPVTILLTYAPIPNAMFLDIPVAGNIAYSLAEIGRRIIGVEGYPSLAAGLLIVVAPPAAVAAGVKAARTVSISVGGRRRGPERDTLQPLMLLASANTREKGEEEAFRASGRIIIPDELRQVLQSSIDGEIAGEAVLSQPMEDEAGLDNLALEAEEALAKVLDGGKATLQPYQLALVYMDEARLEKVKEAFLEKRLKIGNEMGYLGLDRYGSKIHSLINRGYTSIVVKASDIWLGAVLAAEACRRAGLQPRVLEPPYDTKPKKLAEAVKKSAGGAGAVIFVNPDPEAEKAIAQATLNTGKTHVIVSESPFLPPSVEIPTLSDEEYMPVAVAVAAREKLLHRMSLRDLEYFAKLSALNGYTSLEKAAKHLRELEEGEDIGQALRSFFTSELRNTFTQAELELLTQAPSVEQLRTAYMALVRQIDPGADPAHRFNKFLNKLRRLGMIEEN